MTLIHAIALAILVLLGSNPAKHRPTDGISIVAMKPKIQDRHPAYWAAAATAVPYLQLPGRKTP